MFSQRGCLYKIPSRESLIPLAGGQVGQAVVFEGYLYRVMSTFSAQLSTNAADVSFDIRAMCPRMPHQSSMSR